MGLVWAAMARLSTGGASRMVPVANTVLGSAAVGYVTEKEKDSLLSTSRSKAAETVT